jgi:fimbrial chaperone protein
MAPRRFLAALLLLLGQAAQAAGLSLSPVNLRLDRLTDRATLQLSNDGREPVVMQAEAIRWTREAGVDVDQPTQDLIVNPPVFTVLPGQSQVLRVGMRRKPELSQEAAYRIVLREVPVPRAADAEHTPGQVRVLLAMRVPVYVAPLDVRRGEQWQIVRSSAGELTALLLNVGNVHLRIGELRLQGDGGLDVPVPQPRGNPVVFPGEQRSFRLPDVAQATHLLVQTDQGPKSVALDGSGAARP